jgi:hypothetical protein
MLHDCIAGLASWQDGRQGCQQLLQVFHSLGVGAANQAL